MSVSSAAPALRAPSAADRERVREIVEATGLFRPDETAVALDVFDDAVAGPGVDYHPLGAFDPDERLVGFAFYGTTPCTEDTWDLYWIAVDPEGQRHGVGRQLIEACEHHIASLGGRLLMAETSSREDYGPTRAFYEALGYRAEARIAEFYAPHDDLVVYTKRLLSSEKATQSNV